MLNYQRVFAKKSTSTHINVVTFAVTQGCDGVQAARNAGTTWQGVKRNQLWF